MKKYSDKLKNPKWQKKRLEILSRDKWSCQLCHDKESTLHVHHRYYEKNKEPWEYDDNALITLCEYCHQDESEQRSEYENLLLMELRKHFFSDDIREIAVGFNLYKNFHLHYLCASVIKYILSDQDLLYKIYEEYTESLINKNHENELN